MLVAPLLDGAVRTAYRVRMTTDELKRVIELHSLWITDHVLDGVRADFTAKDLRNADFRDCDLRCAGFERADLRGANFNGAKLDGVEMNGALLDHATMVGATMTGAGLRRARLNHANLRGTNLTEASFNCADMFGCNLTDATIHETDFTHADLSAATLTGTSMASHIEAVRQDLELVLSWAPHEAPAVLAALEAGQVDGRVYSGDCACLVGTIAKERKVHMRQIPVRARARPGELAQDPYAPAEYWFRRILPGQTPQNNADAALAAMWVRDFIRRHRALAGEATQ